MSKFKLKDFRKFLTYLFEGDKFTPNLILEAYDLNWIIINFLFSETP
jgi:hypothetical protein